MSDITVIIPTSPIPTAPSTAMIERAIESVRCISCQMRRFLLPQTESTGLILTITDMSKT